MPSARARDPDGAKPMTYSTDDYGSFVRDLAGTTALAIEGGDPEIVPALMKRTDDVDMRLNTTTTQEKAWMLRAAYELTRQSAPLNIVSTARPARNRATARSVWRRRSAQLDAGITLPIAATRPCGARCRCRARRTCRCRPKPTASRSRKPCGPCRASRPILPPQAERPRDDRARRPDGEQLLPPDGGARSAARRTRNRNAGRGRRRQGLSVARHAQRRDVEEARDDRFVAAFNVGTQYQEKPDPKKPLPPPPTFRSPISRAR
jgi:hypothetical protein